MSVEIRFQDPGTHAGDLLEHLLEACETAASGGGIFAWTNRSGAIAILDDPAFRAFAQAGEFHLVVGVDSITDVAALDVLEAREAALSNLTVRAFFHGTGALFHPKLAWFVDNLGVVTLFMGSGNLTMGGLKNNWEAFTVTTLDGKAAEDLLGDISSWLHLNEDKLRPVTDADVRSRAAENKGRERDFKRLGMVSPAPAEPPPPSLPVLVAEIPRAGTRWKQANFDVATYEGFFGAVIGSQRRIALYHVEDDGSLATLESRPSVEVRSRNFRFELDAATGLPYPSNGRPIGVFVKVAAGTFVYRLVLPADPTYNDLVGFLEAEAGQNLPANAMRRVQTTVNTLQAAWPSSPLWSASMQDL